MLNFRLCSLVTLFVVVVDAGNSLRCVSSLEGVHAGGILSIKAGDRWLAVGASDNSMSLFHRPERQGGSRLPPWKLLRTPPRSAAVVRQHKNLNQSIVISFHCPYTGRCACWLFFFDSTMHVFCEFSYLLTTHMWHSFPTQVRCVASDVERGRICSGARNGLLRLWEPVVGY